MVCVALVHNAVNARNETEDGQIHRKNGEVR